MERFQESRAHDWFCCMSGRCLGRKSPDSSWRTLAGRQCRRRAYLGLVCHHGNGHFKLDDDIVFEEGSLIWHAWPALTFNQPDRPSAIWPSNPYDGVKPQDVKHHFFPWCIAAIGLCSTSSSLMVAGIWNFIIAFQVTTIMRFMAHCRLSLAL